MTIEEKRNIVRNFCKNRISCNACRLNNKELSFESAGYSLVGNDCLSIEVASERDLNKAINVIGGYACFNVLTPEEKKFLDEVTSKYNQSKTPTETTDAPTETTDAPTEKRHIRPLSPEQQKVCADVIKFYGYDLQRMVAIEEMSELTKELSKQKRGKGDREHVIEEIADVYICLEMLEQMNGITREELYEWIDKKVDRIDKRIKSEGKIAD